MDIFVSYAAEDRDRAATLVGALQACGWSVWWDRRLAAGATYDVAIERELQEARCVVVLWSHHSVASEWVRNEAAVAAERGVFLPVRIDAVGLPLEFRRKHTVDLIDWNGDTALDDFQALCSGVRAWTGVEMPSTPAATPAIPAARNRRSMAIVVLAGIVLAGFVIYRAVTGAGGPSGPADLIAGTYEGDIVSDSLGGSRLGVKVSIARLAPQKVRVTSDYARLRAAEIEIARSGSQVLSLGGVHALTVDLDKRPPQLNYNFDHEIAYLGRKQ